MATFHSGKYLLGKIPKFEFRAFLPFHFMKFESFAIQLICFVENIQASGDVVVQQLHVAQQQHVVQQQHAVQQRQQH